MESNRTQTPVGKEFFVPNAHDKNVLALAVRDDRLASAGGDKFVVVWNISESKQVLSLNAGVSPITFLSWDGNPNNSPRIASLAPNDKDIRIWDIRSRRDERIPIESGNAIGMAWNPNGNSIALLRDSSIALYDVRQTRSLLTSRKFRDGVSDLSYILNGQSLVIGTKNGSIEFLDPSTLETKHTMFSHTLQLSCVRGNPKNPLQFATGGYDAIINVWETKFLTYEFSIDRQTSSIRHMSFNALGTLLATAADKNIDVARVDAGGDLVASYTATRDIVVLTFDHSTSDNPLLAYSIEDSPHIYVQPVVPEATTMKD